MSPCEEGMSPYFAKFKKFPLSEEGSKWFRCETSVNMSAYIVLDKQIDGRPKYIFLWLNFYNTQEKLFITFTAAEELHDIQYCE